MTATHLSGSQLNGVRFKDFETGHSRGDNLLKLLEGVRLERQSSQALVGGQREMIHNNSCLSHVPVQHTCMQHTTYNYNNIIMRRCMLYFAKFSRYVHTCGKGRQFCRLTSLLDTLFIMTFSGRSMVLATARTTNLAC